MRNTKRGSWFIQELNAALRFHSKDKHLADILVQVRVVFFSHNVLILVSFLRLNLPVFFFFLSFFVIVGQRAH